MSAGLQSSEADAAREPSGGGKAAGPVVMDFDLSDPARGHANIYAGRDGDTGFKFPARETVPLYLDNRPVFVARKPELRECKAVFVVADKEVSQFSDEITVKCAPLV
jgi:hypothetical protein